MTQRIQESQRDQIENLRRYIDSSVGRVNSKVDEITNYQASPKATVDSLTRFVTDIGAAKKPSQTLHFDLSHDDSLDVNAPQGTKPRQPTVQSKDATNRGITSPYFMDLHSRSRRSRLIAEQQQQHLRRQPSQFLKEEPQPRHAFPA